MEAISREKEVDEMKTLAKEFGNLRVDKSGANYSINSLSAEGWEVIGLPTAGIFANRQYFDLAGLSMQEKTLFFSGATIQDTLPPNANPSAPGSVILLADVMSNKPLSDNDIEGVLFAGNIHSGLANAALTFDQTIYMRLRTFNIDLDDQASTYFIPIADNQLGSLSPTASDRVYCTRIVLVSGLADGLYAVSPVRYILQADAKEEPEYEYLMRLKRSYELQNEPDRD